jgi:DNA-binding XRE family transcriptional regulator
MTNHPNRKKLRDEDWPQHLRDFRAEHGLTQEQLAKELRDMSVETISSWERGRSVPHRILELALQQVAYRIRTRKKNALSENAEA